MLQMENIALKLSEFSQNHHPSGVKILAKFIRRGISELYFYGNLTMNSKVKI